MTPDRRLPPGIPEMLEAAGTPPSALDLGCGSGRLTVALATAGAAATGIDISDRRLAQARERARAEGVDVRFLHADMTEPLPFADGEFAAVLSRLSIMIVPDPVRVLDQARRVLVPGGVVVTAVWAGVEENPWFDEARAAAAAALGPDRAAFARAFGRLGDSEELAAVHRDAGLRDITATVLRDELPAPSAAAHWQDLTERIGRFRRLAAALAEDEAAAVVAELERRLEPYRSGAEILLPRAMLLVTARR